jgi:hypothetical protein
VGFFRRREPLHERLAREGGLLGPDPFEPGPRIVPTGVDGVPRARRWDVVVTADTEHDGDHATFVVLPDGTAIVEDGPEDVRPLADAVETALDPPYRAEAVRRSESVWAVAAVRIRVAELDLAGESFEYSDYDGSRTLTVDGAREFGTVPALDELLEGRDGVVRGRRIDGALWEVTPTRL